MINKPQPFSIAMSVYGGDRGEWFDSALQSVTEKQTVKPGEIVLIVDGPAPEEIQTVIDKYSEICQKNNIAWKVFRFSENKGLGEALKTAVRECSYPLIARMDSDDIAVENRFEQQLAYFAQHPETDVLGGDICEFTDDISHPIAKRAVPCTDAEIRELAKIRNPLNHMAVMFKKSAVEAAGGYQDWLSNEDYFLWLRMLLNGAAFANTGTVLVYARVGKEMYQRRGGKKYFQSEMALQRYMREKEIIGGSTYVMNCAKRFIVRILLPNRVRGWALRTFARSKC